MKRFSAMVTLGVLAVSLFSACSYFIAPKQLPREDDWDTQVRNFHVLQPSADTMEARFSWPRSPDWMDGDESIDMVHIVYSTQAPPVSRIVFDSPPNTGGALFSRSSGQYGYRMHLDSVPPPGTEVWYAMFVHSKWDGWAAPVYESLVVQESLSSQSSVYSIPSPSTPQRIAIGYDTMDGSGNINEVTTASYPVSRLGSSYDSVILRFELPDDVEVISADLTLQTVGGPCSFHIYPLAKVQIDDGDALEVRETLVDPEFDVSPTVFPVTDPMTVSIPEIIQQAILHGSDAILIEAVYDGESADIDFNPSTEELALTYYSP